MRRVLVFALVMGILSALAVAPALAKKKKPKPPITFEASGTIAVSNPGSLTEASVTGNEFTNTCAIPATQGVDGYVVELSEEISKVAATVLVTGSDATGAYDLDMYFFNEDCSPMGSASTGAADELGAFPAGTKYVLVNAFFGAQVVFDLTATELKI